ncbi:RICIN domain-containing protein [Archangium violaceum]|uniref:RICIN domain-containing protein n=1 Tax=Archangium violaceum TaxID=83451 RepID=UPI002B2A0413|nr:RICIN domain-containing protein [Archangium gephyra]
MKRSILSLLGALPLYLLAPSLAEARVIQNSSSTDFCIGVDQASTDEHARLKQFRCDGKPNQQWSAKRVKQNALNFINKKSELCMGVEDARTDAGAPIRQYECDGSENQKWMFAACPSGARCMMNKKSELCVATERPGHDAALIQAPCNAGPVWTGH